MAIAVGSVSNTPTYGNKVNSTITAPTGITNGNLLVAVLHVGDATALPALVVTPPAGWTEVTNSPASAADSDPYTIAMHIFYKVASGESGNYTFTHTSAETEGYMYRLTGANTTTPIDVAAGATGYTTGGTGQTTTLASITTVTNDAFIIAADSAWDAPGAGNYSGTTPTLTARRTGSISKIFDGTQTTAGATGSRTRTNGNSGTNLRWASLVVAIRPTGTTSYTLAAETGTATASGQANRLARSRLFPAVNGTLTLAGPVVNLIYSGAGPKTMPAGIGFPALGGQAAVLRRTRVMPAVQGTLTASGQTAVLRRTRKILAVNGTLTASGQANRLARSHKMASVNGVLMLAGPVVNLIYSAGAKVLPAGLGFPVLGGQSVTLRYGHKTLTATGTVVLTGQNVSLNYHALQDYVLEAGTGDLYFSGIPAWLQGPTAQPGPLRFGHARVYLNRW